MKAQFKRRETTRGAVAVIIVLMFSVGWILTGCQAATPTPTPMPTATATPMPTATASATPNVAATQTAQAQASITAQAAVTATLQMQVGATMTAQRAGVVTVQAQQTASAATVQAQQAAAAAATAQFVNVFADTLAKSANKVAGPMEGIIDESQVPRVSVPWHANSGISTDDFIVEARFFNPPNAGNRTWDYGFVFRWPFPPPVTAGPSCPIRYHLRIGSDKTYFLVFVTGKALSGSDCEQKRVAEGTVTNFDVSPTGSNLLRLIVRGKMAIFYVNGQYQATFDVSDLTGVGGVFVRAGFTMQPPLPTRFTDLTVWSFR